MQVLIKLESMEKNKSKKKADLNKMFDIWGGEGEGGDELDELDDVGDGHGHADDDEDEDDNDDNDDYDDNGKPDLNKISKPDFDFLNSQFSMSYFDFSFSILNARF